MKLNLGCSDALEPGYLNVDICPPADQIVDLRNPWPWPDSSIERIRAFDIVEHLPDKIHTMNEAHRVLVSGGILDIFVPLFPGSGSVQDPTHVSYWVERSFLYFEDRNIYRDRFALAYGTTARFRTIAKMVHDSIDGPKLRITLEAVK